MHYDLEKCSNRELESVPKNNSMIFTKSLYSSQKILEEMGLVVVVVFTIF